MSIFSCTYRFFDRKHIFLNTLEKLSIFLRIFETFSSQAQHFYKNNFFWKSVRTTETTLLQIILKKKLISELPFERYRFEKRPIWILGKCTFCGFFYKSTVWCRFPVFLLSLHSIMNYSKKKFQLKNYCFWEVVHTHPKDFRRLNGGPENSCISCLKSKTIKFSYKVC